MTTRGVRPLHYDGPNLFRLLELDWVHTANSAAARGALRCWSHDRDAFVGLASPAEVVRRCHDRQQPERAQALLAAVLAQADDDQWAARTVLQAVVPGLASLSRRASCYVGGPWPVWHGIDDLDQFVVTTAYERIAALAPTPVLWPARTIVDGTWQRIRGHVASVRRDSRRQVALAEASAVAAPPVRSAADELASVLIDAVQRGVISRVDAAVVYSSRIQGRRAEELGQVLDRNARSVWRRRARAEEQLVAHWATVDPGDAQPAAAAG